VSVPVLVLFISLSIGNAQTKPERIGNEKILLENFEKDEVGEFPKGWYDRDGNKQLLDHDYETVKDYNYKVAEEKGNKYLHYQGVSAKHINFPLINRDKDNIYNINIYNTPILSWKVRAHDLPENANEDSSDIIYISTTQRFFHGKFALIICRKMPTKTAATGMIR